MKVRPENAVTAFPEPADTFKFYDPSLKATLSLTAHGEWLLTPHDEFGYDLGRGTVEISDHSAGRFIRKLGDREQAKTGA